MFEGIFRIQTWRISPCCLLSFSRAICSLAVPTLCRKIGSKFGCSVASVRIRCRKPAFRGIDKTSRTVLCWQTLQGCRMAFTAFLSTSWYTSPDPSNFGKLLIKSTASLSLLLITTITNRILPRRRSSRVRAKVLAIHPMAGGVERRGSRPLLPVYYYTGCAHYWVSQNPSLSEPLTRNLFCAIVTQSR